MLMSKYIETIFIKVKDRLFWQFEDSKVDEDYEEAKRFRGNTEDDDCSLSHMLMKYWTSDCFWYSLKFSLVQHSSR